ncbi:MAG: undecaprenyl/decaprenyl-phosphate alpha-N-acetylglucosaminyl 1-phosphate transferase, partial [Candidatus Promineifilaceae bacterium]
MLVFIAIFFIALAATAVGTPQVKQLAQNLGFVDVPGGRKSQEQPIPLLGGLAIIGGMLLAVTLFFFVAYGRLPRPVGGVLLASAVVAAVGLVDDRLQLPFWAKLAGEFCGALILIYFGIHVQLPLPTIVNYAITIIWILGISNAV